MNKREIHETLRDAEEYIRHLKNLNSELENAEMQIKNTAQETKTNINKTFDDLLNYITMLLNDRKEKLLTEVKRVEIEGITPLQESCLLISEHLKKTEQLIKMGKKLEQNDALINNVEEFSDNASIIGNLPEVPELKEVPCISFLMEENIKNNLSELINSYGSISGIAPVQISATHAKPGAILVEWQCVDPSDRLLDVQIYRLQRAFGNVIFNDILFTNFKDCYTGNETQFLVKEVQPCQSYSFRVCCKYEKSSMWSPWSIPQVASTSLKPYEWKNNTKFALSNDNKIATPIYAPSVISSNGSQVLIRCSVEFMILECDDTDNSTYIGLYQKKDGEVTSFDELMPNSFLIRNNGYIYINGSEKSTILPKFFKGIKVCFTYDKQMQNKIRITVDSCDKRVTYDWTLEEKYDELNFAAAFGSKKWKIFVE